MSIEDIHVLQTEPLKRLIQAGHQVLFREPLAVWSGPHAITCFGRDDQFIARHIAYNLANDKFGISCWLTVIVRKIEVCHSKIKGTIEACACYLFITVTTERFPCS